jgi:hypothetical protein
MVVDSIEVDPTCDEYMPQPERGHRLVLSLPVADIRSVQLYAWRHPWLLRVIDDRVGRGDGRPRNDRRDVPSDPHRHHLMR